MRPSRNICFARNLLSYTKRFITDRSSKPSVKKLGLEVSKMKVHHTLRHRLVEYTLKERVGRVQA